MMESHAAVRPSEPLLSRDEIAIRVREIASQVVRDLAGERPLLIGVLKGSVMFVSDLARAMGTVDPDVDFMAISSYGPRDAGSSGVVKILKDSEAPMMDRHVILVEDVIDTGLTLAFLLHTLEARGPASVRVCTFVNKPSHRIAEPRIDYAAFETEQYVVGYGLDLKGRFRNLPHLCAIDEAEVVLRSDGGRSR